MRNLLWGRRIGIGITIAVLSGFFLEAFSPQQENLEDDPAPEHAKLNTADAATVEPRHMEVEFYYSYNRARHIWIFNGSSQPRGLCEEHFPGMAVTVGAGKNLDFNIALGCLWLHDEDNCGPARGNAQGDLGIGGRYRFLNSEKSRLEGAYIGGVTIPTGSKSNEHRLGTSQEYLSWDHSLVLSKDWGKWTANVEIAFSLPLGNKRGDLRGIAGINVAAGCQLLGWLQPEVELNYGRDFAAGAEDAKNLALTAGLVMPVSSRLLIIVGMQRNVWGRNTDRSMGFLLDAKVIL